MCYLILASECFSQHSLSNPFLLDRSMCKTTVAVWLLLALLWKCLCPYHLLQTYRIIQESHANFYQKSSFYLSMGVTIFLPVSVADIGVGI